MNTFQNTAARPALPLTCCLGVLLCLTQNPLGAQSGRSLAPPTDKNPAPSRQASEAGKDANASGEKPAAPLPDEASRLRDDPRLQRKVTLDELGTPLAELLNKLSSDKLTLKADPNCREFKLQIRLKQRPLYMLMQSLAQLYDGYWQERSDKQGYRFAQRLQTIRRRDAWWHLYLTERDQALKQISAAVVADMKLPVKARDPNAPEYQKEPGDPEREAMTARSHNAFGQFDGTLQQRIAQSLDPIFTCDMEGFQGFLPNEGGAIARLRDLPPDAQKMVFQHAPFLTPDANPFIHFSNTGDYVGAQIVRPGGSWSEAGLRLAGVRRPSALVMAVCWINHAQLARLLPALPARKQGAPHAPSAPLSRSSIPEEWQQLADWQRSRVWPNDAGKILYGKVRMFPAPLRVERLQWLGRQAGMEYVSDYYADTGRRMQEEERDLPLTRPLKEELDALALEQDVSWKRGQEAIYLFRNNRWYRDDQLGIPDAYARALLPRCVSAFADEPRDERKTSNSTPGPTSEQIAAQLQMESEIVSALTPWQIANGFQRYRLADGVMPVRSFFEKYQQPPGGFPPIRATLEEHSGPNGSSQAQGKPPAKRGKSKSAPEIKHVWQPFAFIAHLLLEHHRLLLFYAGLGEEQRDALLHSRLAWNTLTSRQQEQVADFAPLVMAEGAQAAPAEPLLGIHAQFDGGGNFGDNETFPILALNILELYVANANTAPAQP